MQFIYMGCQATLTTKNAMDMMPLGGNRLPGVELAFYPLTYANEHYVQLVIYLQISNIIPPASRPDRPKQGVALPSF
jgi:hypothetical protein